MRLVKQQRCTVMGLELRCESGGCGASHETEIADQVRLVVVAGGMGDLRPGDGTLAVRGSFEAQSVDEAGDAGHGLWSYAGEVEGPAFELARAGAERSGEFTDGVCAAILCDTGERPGPVRVSSSVLGGEPFEHKLVEQEDALGERTGFGRGWRRAA